jgi:hypothetical protein
MNRLSFERSVDRLHGLGPRPVGGLLLELAAISGRREWLDQRLATYADLDPQVIRAFRADHFSPPPLHAVVNS